MARNKAKEEMGNAPSGGSVEERDQPVSEVELVQRLSALKTQVGRAKDALSGDRAFEELAARVAKAAVPNAFEGTSETLKKFSSQLTHDEATLVALLAEAEEPTEVEPSEIVSEEDEPPPPLPRVALEEAAKLLRAHPRRAPARIPMRADISLQSESNFFVGFSVNLSDGGIFLATEQDLPIGTEVELEFSLPGAEKLKLQGVVRWRREVDPHAPYITPGIGVQFVKVTEEVQEAIRRFVAEREPIFYPD